MEQDVTENSTFKRMRDISYRPVDLFHSSLAVVGGFFSGIGIIRRILWLILLTAVPVSMIVVGSLYLRSCPVQPMIPIFLIVFGALLIISIFLVTYPSFGSIIWLLLLIWFVIGCYWIYSIYKPSDSDCNRTLYIFSFWTNNLVFILVAFLIVCFCLMCCIGFTSIAAAQMYEF